MLGHNPVRGGAGRGYWPAEKNLGGFLDDVSSDGLFHVHPRARARAGSRGIFAAADR